MSSFTMEAVVVASTVAACWLAAEK